ncbi:terminase gpA endonuclease subunit [Spartinivicinus ruber]|uniref:terminase gpA endonuclease subunit n=1 Tax=Spartinivicinus ruber TaxID=2683272 RepID=UPI001CA42D4A|nr:terminase gpA endonuclease subunit [Spartinivicinus ruber]
MAKMVDRPPPRTADEWARDNRVMPLGSPIPGPFDPSVNPYMQPIVAAFAKPQYNRITFVMGTQMGKSVTMENVVGWRLDDDPTPVLYVAPTSNLIDSTIEPKFDALFLQSETLAKKYDHRRSTKYTKWLGGIKFRFAWAGSPTELAADSAGLVLVDEVDRIVNTNEGDTTTIIEARGDAFANSKVAYTATPTKGRVGRFTHPKTKTAHWEITELDKLHSKVWKLWQQGTRHEWCVPCPHCHHYFIPWSGLLTPGIGDEGEVTPEAAEKKAGLRCPHCSVVIEDKYRRKMNERGVIIAPGEMVNQQGEITGTADTAGNTHFSAWVSGLCSFSPKKTYGYCAKRLIEALRTGDPETLQGVFNTVFGEPYDQPGDAPKWEEVKYHICQQIPPGKVLANPKFLLCTVDVQKRRLVYVVRAWWPGMGSQLVEHGELFGETDHPEVWEALSLLLEQEWSGYGIKQMGIDSGYRPDDVYAFARKHRGRCRVLRGDKMNRLFRMIRVGVTQQGRISRERTETRWDFDSSRAKAWVHSRIGRPYNKPAWWVLSSATTDDYCKEIVGEEYDELNDEWKQVGENHYLDCEAMQFILANILNVHRIKRNIDFYPLLEGNNQTTTEKKKASVPSTPTPEVKTQPSAPADPLNDWLTCT